MLRHDEDEEEVVEEVDIGKKGERVQLRGINLSCDLISNGSISLYELCDLALDALKRFKEIDASDPNNNKEL